jgi:regulator of protease activity HflC (stomatin/prohibitin superfamily)
MFRVNEGHVAVLTRFGAARPGLHGPGLHAKAPWDRVLIVPTHEQTLAFVGEQDGHRILTADGTLLRFDCAVRWVPVVSRARPPAVRPHRADPPHQGPVRLHPPRRGRRLRIAQRTDADWIRHAGSYATIRRDLARLRHNIEAACQRRIGPAYGVQFIAVDIVDILPPDDLADGLNAVIQAEAESAAAFFRSQGECQQRVLSAHSGVDIARAHALAAETELRTLGHHLGQLAATGTLADYVARRRDETLAESRTLYLKDPVA